MNVVFTAPYTSFANELGEGEKGERSSATASHLLANGFAIYRASCEICVRSSPVWRHHNPSHYTPPCLMNTYIDHVMRRMCQPPTTISNISDATTTSPSTSDSAALPIQAIFELLIHNDRQLLTMSREKRNFLGGVTSTCGGSTHDCQEYSMWHGVDHDICPLLRQ